MALFLTVLEVDNELIKTLTQGRVMTAIYTTTSHLLQQQQPELPLYLFHRPLLEGNVQRFMAGFPGLVTYAVKANPNPMIIQTMLEQGMQAFDVASLAEIELVQGLAWQAGKRVALHYHNPIKTEAAIAKAWFDHGVRCFSLDDELELEKLKRQVPNPSETELSVRFVAPEKHDVQLDLNSKFGANETDAAALLRLVAEAGFKPSLTFHPGTQCTEAKAYSDFIACAARIVKASGVELHRLNVGGGFAANYLHSQAPDLNNYFDAINSAVAEHFDVAPQLVCEPGRALVNDTVSLLVKVIHRRKGGQVFINDGVYGGFSEMNICNMGWPYLCWRGDQPLAGQVADFTVYGPTCDSVDVMPHHLPMPEQLAVGDYIEVPLMGAYSSSVATQFNGFQSNTYVQVTQSSYLTIEDGATMPKVSGL